MTPELLLQNSFFAFWYFLGEYFLAIWGVALFISIVTALIYFIARR